jgi:regulator of RNase E activity RraA
LKSKAYQFYFVIEGVYAMKKINTPRSAIFAVGLIALLTGILAFAVAQKKAPPVPGDPLIAGFKTTYAASVSDAVELVTGKRGFMSHDMKPVIPGLLVGRAVTSFVKAAPPEQATPALSTKHSVEMIDNANPGEVGVIVMENGLDVAAMGNLMGTAAKVRGMAGMVLDGGVRDVSDLRTMGLTVYARSIVPSTAVGRFATVARNIPVECAGVTVKPGDIIVANEDGVVVVPQERAEEVLKRALEIDEREKKMYPLIKKHRGLQKAIEIFNRI